MTTVKNDFKSFIIAYKIFFENKTDMFMYIT
jgi:hypothetical protein